MSLKWLKWMSITNNKHPFTSQFNNNNNNNNNKKESCSFPVASLPASSTSMAARIAIIGDVHDEWDYQLDSQALLFLQPDVLLFTGDFGNENVELVSSISQLQFPKAVILGNHDTWSTHHFSSKTKDRVRLQLDSLGRDHVGYTHLDFPSLKLSVVGGRPFSCGGSNLFRKHLLSARYGINSMEESAKRIYTATTRTPEDHFIIFLAHNGPTGLGSNMDDICGKDWMYGGGDHGDPDLAQAISMVKESTNYSIPLVVFGHMHKELAYGGQRKMMVVGADKTMYLNGAIVPRVKYPSSGGSVRAFTMVDFCGGEISKVAETWVLVNDDATSLAEEHVLFTGGGGSSKTSE